MFLSLFLGRISFIHLVFTAPGSSPPRTFSSCSKRASSQGGSSFRAHVPAAPASGRRTQARKLCRGISCPVSCGIFSNQGSNLSPLLFGRQILKYWSTREDPKMSSFLKTTLTYDSQDMLPPWRSPGHHSGAVPHLRCGNWVSGKSFSVWFESINIYMSDMVQEGPAPLGIPRPADLAHSQSRVAKWHTHTHTQLGSHNTESVQAVEAQAFSRFCWLTWSQVPVLNICPTRKSPVIFICAFLSQCSRGDISLPRLRLIWRLPISPHFGS